jgi:hypothetical protein
MPSSRPTSRPWMRAHKDSSATSSASWTRPAASSTGCRRIRSSSAASFPTPTPKSLVSFFGHVFSYDHPWLLAVTSSSSRPGVTGPDPPRGFPSRDRLGECLGGAPSLHACGTSPPASRRSPVTEFTRVPPRPSLWCPPCPGQTSASGSRSSLSGA